MGGQDPGLAGVGAEFSAAEFGITPWVPRLIGESEIPLELIGDTGVSAGSSAGVPVASYGSSAGVIASISVIRGGGLWPGDEEDIGFIPTVEPGSKSSCQLSAQFDQIILSVKNHLLLTASRKLPARKRLFLFFPTYNP